MKSGYRIAVVGASTTVGKEIIQILEERDFPVHELVPLEKKGSAGDSVQFKDQDISVKDLDTKKFKGIHFSFFASGGKISEEYVRSAVEQGSVVIDTTEAFHLDGDVPLVIPEINAHRIPLHKGVIASPSPSTIQLALVLSPIHKKAGIKRIVLSTYQAISDMGDTAMNELTEQIADLFNFREAQSAVFQHQIAFNAIPQVGAFLDNEYTSGEMHVIDEMKKILEDDRVRICATDVYVPAFYSHSQSVNIETIKKVDTGWIRTLLKGSPGVKVEDNPSEGVYPLAVYATGKDECFVGRIRKDLSADNGIVLWTAMDNIRKGSALNAIQIAEHIVSLDR